MTHSDQLNELATALSKAQAKIEGATKSSANPFFKSHYADLASVWDACRKQLTDVGLSVTQMPYTEGNTIGVQTVLLHSSGQWMESTVSANAKDLSPQAVGSVITYLRRYALSAVAGVPQVDDDAEAGEGRTVATPRPAYAMKRDTAADSHIPPTREPGDELLDVLPDSPTDDMDQWHERQQTGGAARISVAQRKRLYAIAKGKGWTNDNMARALKDKFGYDRSDSIFVQDYNQIVTFYESGGQQ